MIINNFNPDQMSYVKGFQKVLMELKFNDRIEILDEMKQDIINEFYQQVASKEDELKELKKQLSKTDKPDPSRKNS